MGNPLFITQKKGLTFSIRVSSNAKTAKIGDVVFDTKRRHILNVYVNATPENGKANEAIVMLLADFWQLKKTHITILKGFKNRNKVVYIAGDPAILVTHIEKFLKV